MLTTVTSFYANSYLQKTYANDVKNSKLDAGTTAYLTLSTIHNSRGNYTPEKAEHKQRKKMRRPDVRSWIAVTS